MFKNTFNYYIKMLVFSTGIFLSSCFDKDTDKTTDKYFFDLVSFFEQESVLLQEKNIGVEKILINNKDTQIVVLNNLNWKEELAPFINNDINKPAWRDSYRIDSVFEDNSIKNISYNAIDRTLPVKQIQVYFKNSEIEHIYIENNKSNYVYNSAIVLTYYKNKGYSIEGEQDIILGKDLHYKIHANFVKEKAGSY